MKAIAIEVDIIEIEYYKNLLRSDVCWNPGGFRPSGRRL